MRYSLCGSSNCPWEPIDPGTDVLWLGSWNLFHSPLTALLEEIESLLSCHSSQESILGCILCIGIYRLLYALEILFITAFSSDTESQKSYSVCPPPIPSSLPQEQSKSLHTGPAAYECSFPEASVSTTFQGLDVHFSSQGSELQMESRQLLMCPLT